MSVQVSGCSEYLNLSLLVKGGRDATCLKCDQGNDLLSMVVELEEEVERLRNIRECEREVNVCINSLPYLQVRHRGDMYHTVVDPLPSIIGRGRRPKRWGGMDTGPSFVSNKTDKTCPYLPPCPK